MMAYISVDPEGMQTMIDNLNGYAEATEDARSDATLTNTLNSHDGETPVDLSSFSSKLSEYKGELESKARGLTYRLEAARAANETGMTVTAPDGTISYYVPDDKADNADNIKAHNNVEVWAQAKADIAAAVDYSENGCTVEEWEALLARMREYQNDPSYANTVTNTIGPAKMLDCVVDIQSQFPSVEYGAADAYSPSLAPDAGEDLAEVFGNILATASHTWDDEKAEHYANRMADATREDGKPERIYALNAMLSASRNVDIDGDGAEETVGLDYNDALLTTLAHRLENAKYGSVSKSDSELVDSMYSGDQDINPLSGIVHAMTGNPEASTTWLTVYKDDGSVDAEATAERTKKLVERSSIGENEWTTDCTLLAAQNAISGQSVAPNEQYHDSNGAAQAAIVSGVLNAVGGDEEGVTIAQPARNAVSIALASYPYGVQQSAQSGGPGLLVLDTEEDSWGQAIPDQPIIANRALANLIGQVSASEEPTDLARVAGSQEVLNKLQISTEVETATASGDYGALGDTLDQQSQTRGFITGAIARQSAIDGANADARAAQWANAASNAINAIPAPQAKGGSILLRIATEFAAGSGKSSVADAAKEGVNNGFANARSNADRKNQEDHNVDHSLNTAANTLALLRSDVYSHSELESVVRDNQGASLNSVLTPEGTIIVQDDADNLTPEEVTQLEHLAGRLRNGEHPGLDDLRSRSQTNFNTGYASATGEDLPDPKVGEG